jgi:hypothetical protein
MSRLHTGNRFAEPLVAVTVLLLASAAALHAGFKDYSTSHQSRGFKNQEGTLVFARELSETAERITVKAKVKVKEGAVTIRLEDPYGNPVWNQRVEAEDEVERKEWFNGKRGEWRLLLVFEDASGRYNVKLSTR